MSGNGFTLEEEVRRLRLRVHRHNTRLRTVELQQDHLGALFENVTGRMAEIGDAVSQIAKRDEIADAVKAAVVQERRHWLHWLNAPMRSLVWLAGGVGAALVIADAVKGLF